MRTTEKNTHLLLAKGAALFIMLMLFPMQAFAEGSLDDLLPDEYDYAAHIKFIDEEGDPVPGGIFESNWKVVPYNSERGLYVLEPEGPKINMQGSCEAIHSADDPDLTYTTDRGLTVRNYCTVEKLDEDAYFVDKWRHHLENGTLKEIRTPEGYAPVTGYVQFSLEANEKDDGARLIRDTTGRAYVDGNTIYIVYHKYAENEGPAQTDGQDKPASEEPKMSAQNDPAPLVQQQADQTAPDVKIKNVAVKPSKKAITVKWKKLTKGDQKKISGIEIQVSKTKDFKASKTYKAKKTAAAKRIKKLSGKTKYYVRVRVCDGSHYGKWSKIKTVKVK